MEEIGGMRIGSGRAPLLLKYIKYALYLWALLYVALHSARVL